MASLNKLKTNVQRINEGAWVTVEIDEDNTFDIRTRGFTARYRDTLQRLKTEAAQAVNRKLNPGERIITADTLPSSIEDVCQGKALADECVLDVRDLFHDDGTLATVDEFREMLNDAEQCRAAILLAMQAAQKVTADRDEDTKAAVGN